MLSLLNWFPLRKRAFWAAAVVSALVGAACYYTILQSIEADAFDSFQNHARNAQQRIAARIKSYTDVLRAGASLLESADEVPREQFRDYVTGLHIERNFPGIVSVNFGARVRADELAGFERRLRAEQARHWFGKGPFTVTPPGRRDEYCVLTVIEGGPVEAAAFGLDMLSVPFAARILGPSRDTGTLIASGQPVKAISRPNNISLGMRVPVYRHGMPLRNVAERRAAYIGSLGIAFNIPQLVHGVLEGIPIPGVRMILVDRDGDGYGHGLDKGPPKQRVLFDSAGTPAMPEPPFHPGPDRFTTAQEFDYNGRPWVATFTTPKANMYAGDTEYFPWYAAAAGSVTAFLVFALLYTLTSSRRRAMAIAEEMTREMRDSEARLRESHRNLRRLAAHADRIKEGERKRIAREIHDDLGQNLLALRIDADMLAMRTAHHHPRLNERARATVSQIDAIIKSVRQIINDLRPNVLDLGLSAAVEWQVSEFRRRTGIACELHDEHNDIRVADHCATALFRILQESLSNISRHAKAAHVCVLLQMDARSLTMTVSDDGIGFPSGGRHKVGSFGLIGIEERLHILGGACRITSLPGHGTTVLVQVPLQDVIREHPAAPLLRSVPTDAVV